MANIDSTPYSGDPYNTLDFRFSQIRSLLDCLNIVVTASDGAIEHNPTMLSEAIWGISTLVDQAKESWDAIQEHDRAVVLEKRN